MTPKGVWAVAGMLLVAAAVVVWLALGTVTGGGSGATTRPAEGTSRTVAPSTAEQTREAPPVAAPAKPVASATESGAPSAPRLVVAWQPSHQDDTGPGPWHEYLICSDLADRASRRLQGLTSVKAWDTSHGLFGSNNYPHPINTRPFDAEVETANRAGADLFISLHNDSEAPSGVLAECQPGDAQGMALARRLVDRLSARTGLRNRGVREVRLYSLEPSRNHARFRCLLEIGDNVRDRDFLEDPARRELVATVLADVVRGWTVR